MISARKLHQHLKLSDAVLYDAGVEDFNDNSPNYRDKNLEGDNAGVVIQWADSGWINFGYSIRFAKVTWKYGRINRVNDLSLNPATIFYDRIRIKID